MRRAGIVVGFVALSVVGGSCGGGRSVQDSTADYCSLVGEIVADPFDPSVVLARLDEIVEAAPPAIRDEVFLWATTLTGEFQLVPDKTPEAERGEVEARNEQMLETAFARIGAFEASNCPPGAALMAP